MDDDPNLHHDDRGPYRAPTETGAPRFDFTPRGAETPAGYWQRIGTEFTRLADELSEIIADARAELERLREKNDSTATQLRLERRGP